MSLALIPDLYFQRDETSVSLTTTPTKQRLSDITPPSACQSQSMETTPVKQRASDIGFPTQFSKVVKKIKRFVELGLTFFRGVISYEEVMHDLKTVFRNVYLTFVEF